MNLTGRIAAIALSLSPLAYADGLPDLGDASQVGFSPQEERKLGESVVREIRASGQYLEDPEVTDYINGLGYRLVAGSVDNKQDFQFFLVDDNTVNAFALPGGFIGVNTGLILTAQSESELAAVLGHEMAHVTQHHLARLIASQKPVQIGSLAAMALAILAARSNSAQMGQVGQAAIATAQGVAVQSQLNFTRDNEREADRIGLQTLENSGLDPRAMATFFERMQKATQFYETNAPAYLRTHPLTYERIAEVQNRLQDYPYRQVLDNPDFQILKAKLRANQDSPREAVDFFDNGLKDHKYSNELAQRYGLVAALVRAKNYARAQNELAALRKIAGTPNPFIETLAGQVLANSGQLSAALKHYRAATVSFPNHRELVYDYADALLKARQENGALKLVNDQLALGRSDGVLYELQARAYAAQGKLLLHHQAQAEAYLRQGSIPAAIEQLQIALKSGDGDFYQLSQVEARLRELRDLDADSHPDGGGRRKKGN